LEPTAAQFLYRRTEAVRLQGAAPLTGPEYDLIEKVLVESWVAPDGSGRSTSRYDEVSFASEADRQAWVADGSPALPQVGSTEQLRYGAGGLPYYATDALPSDPQALRKVLEGGSVIQAGQGDANLLDAIGILLAQQTASGEVRQALFEVAADVPGIMVEHGVKDPLGREAVAIAVSDPTGETRLFLDPADASLLAISRTKPDTPAPSWQAFTASGVVDEIGAVPGSGAG
jgi:hypothetical protein